MSQSVVSQANLSLAGNYLKTIPSGDISSQYFRGQQTYKSSAWVRFKMFFAISSYLNELKSFYPYQKVVSKSLQVYNQQQDSNIKNSLIITVGSWFTIFNLARRGYVAPILKQYGGIFKTHRLFRHYLYSATLPYLVFSIWTNWKWLNHTEACWAVHSRRMNAKMTVDPQYTEYPNTMLKPTWKGALKQEKVLREDLAQLLANQVSILEAPGFSEKQVQNQQIPTPEQNGQQGEQEEQ